MTDAAGEAAGRARRPVPGGLWAALPVLALGYTAWAASPVLVPLMLALFLALVANPIVRLLRRLWLPRWLAAMAVVLGGLAGAVLLAGLLVTPAAEWIRQAPSEIRQHAPKLRELTKPIAEANQAATESLEQLAGEPARRSGRVQVVEQAPGNLWTVLSGTPLTLASGGVVVLLSYFFLVFGGDVIRRALAQLEDPRRQRLTVDILHTVEREVSRYVLTITLINIGLGAATVLVLWLVGLAVEDALLWGTVVGLLNYAQYIGPLVATIALALVGMVAFQDLAQAMLVPGSYLALNLLESQLVTPIVLGRRMALSPAVLLVWLLLWGWLWGIAGLLLAVPMLVTFKIVAGRVEGWQGWAQVVGR